MPFENLVFPSAGSLSVAVVAAFIFILQIWFAIKRSEFRWFVWSAAVSFSTILYAVGILLEYNAPEGPINRFGGLLEWTAVIFLIHALYGFVFSRLNIPSRRYHLAAGGFHVLILILLWSTNILVSDHFVSRPFLTLQKPFVEADIGPLGPVFMLYALGAAINAIRIWIVKERQMETRSRAYVWGASFWILLGAHDAAASVGLPTVQYVMEYGFLGFSAALFYTMFSDYLRTSDALAQSNVILRKEMETRNRLEQERRESEKKYRFLVERMNDGLSTYDESDLNTYCNDKFCKMLGYSNDEIMGRPAKDFLDEVNQRILEEHISRRRKGERSTYELVWTRKDGKKISTIISPEPILDSDGHYAGAFAVVTDITQRKQMEETLRTQRDMFEGIIASMGDGLDIVSRDYRVFFQNKLLKDRFGDLTGKLCYEGYMARETPCEPCPMTKAINTGVTQRIEMIGADGKEYELASSPFRDISGETKVIEIVRDITELRRAEEVLRESEEKYRNMFNNAQVGIFRTRISDGKVLECNDRFARTYGYKTAEECIDDFVVSEHYSDPGTREKMLTFLMEKGEVNDIETCFSRKNGDDVWIRFSARAFPEEGYLEGIGYEITEEKRALKALRESEEKYRSVVESTEDSLYLVDRNYAYQFMNKKHLSRFGRPVDNIIGREYGDFHSTEETKEFTKRVKEVFETGKSISYEYRSERDRGYFLRTLSPVKKPDGKITDVTVISKNITDRKQKEEALIKTNEALSREHNQRKTLSRRLIDLLEKDRRRIARELHDHIGQTLTSLKIDIEMIHGKLKPEQREMGARITSAQEKTIQAIKDVKNISRGLRPAMIDTLGVVSSLRELFNEIQRQTDIKIKFFSRNIPKRFTPEKELAIYRIAQEALTNIIRHAKAKNVFVSLVEKDGKLLLSVEDDGVGFDQDKVMIFSKKRGPLGLLFMRERAEQLDGEFTLESQVGKGTHLLVEIPI